MKSGVVNSDFPPHLRHFPGTSVSVQEVASYLADGSSIEDMMEQFPDLRRADIVQLARRVRHESGKHAPTKRSGVSSGQPLDEISQNRPRYNTKPGRSEWGNPEPDRRPGQ